MGSSPTFLVAGPMNQLQPQPVPPVSVVMAVFNGADGVRRTLDGILTQSFAEFELIVVDDGSTDRTPEILAEYREEDSRIRIITQENRGLTEALIAGCDSARGQLIARQDVGDFSLEHRLARQVEYLDQHPNVVAVGTGFRSRGPGGEYLGESVRQLEPEDVTRIFLEQGVGISHTSAMFRAEAYRRAGGYRPEFRFAQDFDLWYRMTRVGRLGEVPEVLLEMGVDIGGISSTSHDRQRRLATLARQSHQRLLAGADDTEILQEAERTSWGEIPQSEVIPARQARARAEFFIGSQLYSLGDGRCRHYFRRAIQHSPLWLRPWAKITLSCLTLQPRRD